MFCGRRRTALRASASIPRAAHAASVYVMLQLMCTCENNVRLSVFNNADCLYELLVAVHEHATACSNKTHSAVRYVSVHRTSGKRSHCLRQPAVRVTNICGQLLHWAHVDPFRPQFLPYVVPVTNSFGSFFCLYSVNTNLLLSSTKQTSLFRGGNNSHQIMETIERVLHPESVHSALVSMIVLSAELDTPISLRNSSLDSCVLDGAPELWTVEEHTIIDDIEYMRGFRLFNFQDAFLAPIELSSAEVKSMLINFNKNGSVNFFVSTSNTLRFERGVEDKYKKLARALVLRFNQRLGTNDAE